MYDAYPWSRSVTQTPVRSSIVLDLWALVTRSPMGYGTWKTYER